MDPWAQTSRDREWGRTNEDGGPDLKHQQYIAAPCWTRTKLHCHLPSWMILVIFGEDVWRCSKMWQLRFAVCTHIFSECLRTWLWRRVRHEWGPTWAMLWQCPMALRWISAGPLFFLMALSRDSCFLSISSEACVSSLVFTGFVHVGVLEIEILEILELQLFNRNEGFGTPLCRQILTQATWSSRRMAALPSWTLVWWEPRSCLCFACFLLFLFVSAMICYILRCAWIFSLAHTCPTLKLAFSCCLHFLECFCGLERLGVACFYNLPELGQYSHS